MPGLDSARDITSLASACDNRTDQPFVGILAFSMSEQTKCIFLKQART